MEIVSTADSAYSSFSPSAKNANAFMNGACGSSDLTMAG